MPQPALRWSIAAVAGILVTACGGHGGQVRFSPAIDVSSATNVGTAPMLAVSPAGATASAWISAPAGGTDGSLYVQVDSGHVSQLSDSLGPIEPHGEAPPKLDYGPHGGLSAIYVVAKDVPTLRFPLTALRFVRSVDGGATWTSPVTVTSDAEFGAHSFHDLHVAHDGTIYVSWLGGEPGKSTAWITHSTDHGVTWAPRVRVDTGNACPCCRTSLGTAPDGTVYMAWRHIYPGNVRDIVVARSTDRGETWSEPVRVHADDWHFDGCPHAGPSLRVDSAGEVHVAWWTGKEKSAGVWYTRSDNGGRSFKPPVALGVADYSKPAHVQLALGHNGTIAAVWDDGTLKVSRIAFRISHNGGRSFDPTQFLSASGWSAGFPVLAIKDSSVTVAWSQQPVAAAAAAAAEMADMKNTKAHKGLEAVGQGEVMLRHGELE